MKKQSFLKYSLRVALALLAFAPLSQSSDINLQCDEGSEVMELSGVVTEWVCSYTSYSDAGRAAQLALKLEMFAKADITVHCANGDCTPSTCHSAVWYWDPSQLTITIIPDGDPADGKWCSRASWNGGEFQAYCTPCTHF